MTNLLDTDVVTLYQRGHRPLVSNILRKPIADLVISVISVEEQLTGWYTRLRRAKRPTELADVYQRLTDAIRFLANFNIVSFTLDAIKRYEQLRQSHRRAGKNDLRIAAIALETNAIIVTRNSRDFAAIPGVRFEDWAV